MPDQGQEHPEHQDHCGKGWIEEKRKDVFSEWSDAGNRRSVNCIAAHNLPAHGILITGFSYCRRRTKVDTRISASPKMWGKPFIPHILGDTQVPLFSYTLTFHGKPAIITAGRDDAFGRASPLLIGGGRQPVSAGWRLCFHLWLLPM